MLGKCGWIIRELDRTITKLAQEPVRGDESPLCRGDKIEGNDEPPQDVSIQVENDEGPDHPLVVENLMEARQMAMLAMSERLGLAHK